MAILNRAVTTCVYPQGPSMFLVVEGPKDTNYTGVAGGQLMSASVEAADSAAEQGRPQHSVALISVDNPSSGATHDIVLNVTASEQARRALIPLHSFVACRGCTLDVVTRRHRPRRCAESPLVGPRTLPYPTTTAA